MASHAFFSPLKPAVVTLWIIPSWHGALAISIQPKSCMWNSVTEIMRLLIFKWSGFIASLQDFLVAQLREQRGTRISLALLWIKKMWNWHPQFRSSKALKHVPVSNVWILLLTSFEVLGSLWVKHMPKCFSGLEILPFLCKSVLKYLQAGMLVF